jgi:hypothetical protein
MRRLFIAAFVAGVAGGCFLKPANAPGFRYSCETDADCLARDCTGTMISMAAAKDKFDGCEREEVVADGTLGVGYRQKCVAGLCEFPCDLFTFQDDCPDNSGFSFCFNGVCANTCGTDDYSRYGFASNDDYCTDPQTCIPIGEGGIDAELFAGFSGGTGGASSLPDGAGFCGLRCDAEGAPDCPPGQYCTGALCIPGCTDPEATPCPAGTICLGAGELAACLTACDAAAELPCPEGQVCVPGLNVCQPSCVGETGVDCAEGFECDIDLGVCVPSELGTDTAPTDT